MIGSVTWHYTLALLISQNGTTGPERNSAIDPQAGMGDEGYAVGVMVMHS